MRHSDRSGAGWRARLGDWLRDDPPVLFLKLLGVATVGFVVLLVLAAVWFGFFATG